MKKSENKQLEFDFDEGEKSLLKLKYNNFDYIISNCTSTNNNMYDYTVQCNTGTYTISSSGDLYY